MRCLSCKGELVYNLEIEKTACRLKKMRKHKKAQTSTASPGLDLAIQLGDFSSDYSCAFEQEADTMANNRTLRELTALDLNHKPLCITFLDIAENVTFELKSDLIHLLPNFYGLLGEDPHKYLQEFHVVCSNIKPLSIIKNQIKMLVFLFSLKGATKD